MTTSSPLTSTQVKWLQYGAGAFLLAIVLFILSCLYRYLEESPAASLKQPPKFESAFNNIDTQKILYDKVTQALTTAQQQNKSLEDRLEKIEHQHNNLVPEEPAKIDIVNERMQALENQIALLSEMKETAAEKQDEGQFLNAIQMPTQGVQMRAPHIASHHLRLSKSPVKLSTKPAKNPDTYVPAGSFAKAVMLGGADVSASVNAQADPTPMLFRVVEEGTLPNHAQSHLKDCVVTAASRGDISSERGLIRLETLSCTRSNGEIVDIAVEGTIFGPEGKNGIRGIPLWRDGQLLQKAFVAGSLSGFANGLAQQNTTTSVSPLGATETIAPGAVFRYGAANGASNAMDKLANYQIQRAEQYHPVIQLSAGTIVDVVFLKGFYLDGKKHQEEEIESTREPKHQEQLPMSENVFDVSPELKDTHLTDPSTSNTPSIGEPL